MEGGREGEGGGVGVGEAGRGVRVGGRSERYIRT